jgi:IS30 family transposase
MKEIGKYEHLSYEERSTIALGLQQGMSVRAIARALATLATRTTLVRAAQIAGGRPYNAIGQQRYQLAGS